MLLRKRAEDILELVGRTTDEAVFVKEGLGCMLTFEHLVDTNTDSELVFRPLTPRLENRMYLIWKKYQVFTPIAKFFIKSLEEGLKPE